MYSINDLSKPSLSRLISATCDPILSLAHPKKTSPQYTVNMPPKRSKTPNHRIKPADRLALAIIGLKTGKFASFRDAASQHAVPETTLRARVKSAFPRRANTRRKELRLTRTEENTLFNWIVMLHESGKDIAPSIVQDMANALLAKRPGRHGFRVTKGWVSGYLQYHPDLSAIVNEHRQRLGAFGLRPTGLIVRPHDPKSVLKACENFVHNTTVMARMQHSMESYIKEKHDEFMRVDLEIARDMASRVMDWREELNEMVRVETQKCEEMFIMVLDLEVDSARFIDGYREMWGVIRETKRIQEEILKDLGWEEMRESVEEVQKEGS